MTQDNSWVRPTEPTTNSSTDEIIKAIQDAKEAIVDAINKNKISTLDTEKTSVVEAPAPVKEEVLEVDKTEEPEKMQNTQDLADKIKVALEKIKSEPKAVEPEKVEETQDLSAEIEAAIKRITESQKTEEISEPVADFSPVTVTPIQEPVKDQNVIDISDLIAETTPEVKPVVNEQPAVVTSPIIEPVAVPTSPVVEAPQVVPASAPIVEPQVVPASAPIIEPQVVPASAPIVEPVITPTSAPITPIVETPTEEIKPDVIAQAEPAVVTTIPTEGKGYSNVTKEYPKDFEVKTGDTPHRVRPRAKQDEKTLTLGTAA